MSKKKIENMSVSELEAEIKRLKEAKSAQAVREKQAARKALVHRKIMIGGSVYSMLKDSGIDLIDMEEEAFKASIKNWEQYLAKYSFNIQKSFRSEQEEAARNAESNPVFEWMQDQDAEKHVED